MEPRFDQHNGQRALRPFQRYSTCGVKSVRVTPKIGPESPTSTVASGMRVFYATPPTTCGSGTRGCGQLSGPIFGVTPTDLTPHVLYRWKGLSALYPLCWSNPSSIFKAFSNYSFYKIKNYFVKNNIKQGSFAALRAASIKLHCKVKSCTIAKKRYI